MATPSWIKPLRRALRARLFAVGLGALGLLPLFHAKRTGRILGSLAWRLAKRDRGFAMDGLTQAFPGMNEEAKAQLAKKSFANLGQCVAELACLRQIDKQLLDYVRLDAADEQVLRDALALGKGVMIVTGHIGNFELMARRVAKITTCATIAKATSSPKINAYVEQMRAKGGVRTLWRGASDVMRGMLGTLRAGHILGMVIDQDTDVQGVFVDFFGKKAHTPRAGSDLALRFKCPVVATFIFRREDGGWQIRAHRIEPDPALAGEEAVIAFTQKMSDAIENAIRQAPDSWVWMHRRWKTQPQGKDATNGVRQ